MRQGDYYIIDLVEQQNFMQRFLFPISLFLSACLLFFIQPMVAKALLPVYGGTPAVWTLCMLFFQALLLLSYAYAWGLSQFSSTRLWRMLHVLLACLSLMAIPLVFQPHPMLQAPEWGILSTLFRQLGLPLLIVGASAPLLQYAYSQSREKNATDPYFLYVASNLGSLLALLSYPWLVERYMGLNTQFRLWSMGYGLYLFCLVWILFSRSYQGIDKPKTESFHVVYTEVAWWVFLSFVPCSLMLGVTFYITTDVAATPLFWIIPLALYLLSFVITFASKPLISHDWVIRNTVFVVTFPLLGFILGPSLIPVWQTVLFHLLAFFMLALLCHGELIRHRPKVAGLTLFYFSLALGGVLAGLFNALVAPKMFVYPFEYPLMILLSLLALPLKRQKSAWVVPVVVFAILLLNAVLLQTPLKPWLYHGVYAEVLALAVLVVWQRSRLSLFVSLSVLYMVLFGSVFQKNDVLIQLRNFYGIKKVVDRNQSHALMSQTTIHGFQLLDNPSIKPKGNVAYYGAIESVIDRLKSRHESMQVSIIGLGAGILACQFRPADHLTLIEIDQQIIDIAKNKDYFTYLQACPSDKKYLADDGRMALEKLKDGSMDLIIVDAFSSDAIPVHLLTNEAFALYQKKINAGGFILVNISNRHLNLLPVLTGAGRALDLIVLTRADQGEPKRGQFASQWVLLTKNEEIAMKIMHQKQWRFVADGESYLWTDDYSNLIPVLKW